MDSGPGRQGMPRSEHASPPSFSSSLLHPLPRQKWGAYKGEGEGVCSIDVSKRSFSPVPGLGCWVSGGKEGRDGHGAYSEFRGQASQKGNVYSCVEDSSPPVHCQALQWTEPSICPLTNCNYFLPGVLKPNYVQGDSQICLPKYNQNKIILNPWIYF